MKHTTIDVVSQEEVLTLWQRTTNTPQRQQIVELTVNVTAHIDRRSETEDIRQWSQHD
jgi:hypothetical protein